MVSATYNKYKETSPDTVFLQMEPMALGSAPSSPSSATTNPNYLPPFLIGDNPVSFNATFQTEICKNESFNLTPTDRNSLRQTLFSPTFTEPNQIGTQSQYDSSENRSGPPKQSLFDTIDIKGTVDTTIYSLSKNKRSPNGLNDSIRLADESFKNESFFIANESFKTINHKQWITVYGFPMSAASIVLAKFANYGTIVDKKFPVQGNWIHLKYNSLVEASKALSQNGKLISNNIMIGVMPYKHPDEEYKDVSHYRTPVKLRSLQQSYIVPQNSNTVISPNGVPQKSTGIFTKAMDYVFGW